MEGGYRVLSMSSHTMYLAESEVLLEVMVKEDVNGKVSFFRRNRLAERKDIDLLSRIMVLNWIWELSLEVVDDESERSGTGN